MSTSASRRSPTDSALCDLRRGAGTELVGYGARLMHPLLLALTASLYGAEQWGVITSAQALLHVASKLVSHGLDRALLYWMPRHPDVSVVSRASRRVLWVALPTSALGAACLAPWAAHMKGTLAAPWQVLALALVPLALIDVFSFAAAGTRRMDALVGVRDVLVPLIFMLLALVAHRLGFRHTGLAWSFVIAQLLGLGLAVLWSRHLIRACMRDDAGVEAQATEIPPELLRYARAMWGAELVGALLYRADTLALTAMAEPRVVGVYGIALQLGNTVRSLRGAFEPLVVAVCSGLSGSGTRASLRDATSYATLLIVASQLLVTGFVACFGTWLLSLFGSGFRAALLPSILLCLGWTLHGSVAIAGAVLSGLGQARSVFGSSLLTLAVLTLSLAVLVPALGAEGAALAVTGSFVAQAVLQQRMVRRHLGAPLYADALVGRLRHFGAGTLCAVVAWLTLGPGVAAAWVAFAIVCAAVLPTLFCWLRRPDQIAMETAT